MVEKRPNHRRLIFERLIGKTSHISDSKCCRQASVHLVIHDSFRGQKKLILVWLLLTYSVTEKAQHVAPTDRDWDCLSLSRLRISSLMAAIAYHPASAPMFDHRSKSHGFTSSPIKYMLLLIAITFLLIYMGHRLHKMFLRRYIRKLWTGMMSVFDRTMSVHSYREYLSFNQDGFCSSAVASNEFLIRLLVSVDITEIHLSRTTLSSLSVHRLLGCASSLHLEHTGPRAALFLNECNSGCINNWTLGVSKVRGKLQGLHYADKYCKAGVSAIYVAVSRQLQINVAPVIPASSKKTRRADPESRSIIETLLCMC